LNKLLISKEFSPLYETVLCYWLQSALGLFLTTEINTQGISRVVIYFNKFEQITY